MKTAEELSACFSSAGIDLNDPIAFDCSNAAINALYYASAIKAAGVDVVIERDLYYFTLPQN